MARPTTARRSCGARPPTRRHLDGGARRRQRSQCRDGSRRRVHAGRLARGPSRLRLGRRTAATTALPGRPALVMLPDDRWLWRRLAEWKRPSSPFAAPRRPLASCACGSMTLPLSRRTGRRDRPDGATLVPYSIASAPDDTATDGSIEFLVKIDARGRWGDHFEPLRRGQRFHVRGPLGRFTFPDDPPEQRFPVHRRGDGHLAAARR